MFGSKRKLQKKSTFARRRRTYKRNNKVAFKRTHKEFKKTHPEIHKSRKKLFYIIFLVLIVGIVSYFLVFSQQLIIREIKIKNEIITDEQLHAELMNQLNNLLGENLFLTTPSNIEKKIKTKFKELSEVRVEKNYPDTLEIEYEEYPLVANVIYEHENVRTSYIINSIGFAVKENLESPNLPFIKIQAYEPANLNKALVEANRLRYILETSTYFTDKFGMGLIEVEYKPIPREIHILTEKNFYIWLDAQRPFEEQLKKLKKALVKLDIYNQELQYIDLRITGTNGDKIIYK